MTRKQTPSPPPQVHSGWKKSSRQPSPERLEDGVEKEWSLDELGECVGQYDRVPEEHRRIRVLDIFCGRGGVGLALRELFKLPNMAGGFLGVDREDYSDTYPGQFVQMDAQEVTLEALGMDEPADVVWLSPVCKPYTRLNRQRYDDPKEEYPTIPELGVHELADRLGRESVIENVPSCGDLNEDRTITLNGGAFGLPIHYRRKFEVSFIDQFPEDRYEQDPPEHREVVKTATSHPADLSAAKGLPPTPDGEAWSEEEARSAIPPTYVAYLLSHCPTMPEIEPPGGISEYQRVQLSSGQQSLSEF